MTLNPTKQAAKTVLGGLAAFALIACSAAGGPSLGSSASPAPSPAASPSASPTASASAPVSDRAVAFADLQGYRLVEGSLELFPIGSDSELRHTLVLKSQSELEKYLAPQAGSRPEPVDFGKAYVLLTVKLTGAYIYQAIITDMQLRAGELQVRYGYKVKYHSDPMLNDHIRPIITVTRFDKVAYTGLAVTSAPLPETP